MFITTCVQQNCLYFLRHKLLSLSLLFLLGSLGCDPENQGGVLLAETSGPYPFGSQLMDELYDNYKQFENGQDYKRVMVVIPIGEGKSIGLLLRPVRLKSYDFHAESNFEATKHSIETAVALYAGDFEPQSPEDFARFNVTQDSYGRKYFSGLLVYKSQVYEFQPTNQTNLLPEAENIVFLPENNNPKNTIYGRAEGSYEVEIGLVGDLALYQKIGASDPIATADYLLSIFNLVSGIYETQLDITIRVPFLEVQTSSFISETNNAYTLLNSFTDWGKTAYATSGAAYVFMLSGKLFENGILGIAWPHSLCKSSGYFGLARIFDQSLFNTTLVVSHELGHSFSLPHDSNCFADLFDHEFIMCPSFIQVSPRFSNQSLETGAQIINESFESGCLPPIY